MKLEDKDSKSHVSWCWKQKRGIKIEEPNNNLCHAYIEKAKGALNMLDSAIEKEEIDWIATTAYYSRYFVFFHPPYLQLSFHQHINLRRFCHFGNSSYYVIDAIAFS